MGLRPAKCYRRLKRAYCRTATRVARRNYIGATPAMRIRQFNMGNPGKEFSHLVELSVDDSIQIRDNAIEAARIAITKALTKKLKKEGFFMKIRVYPHHILRENKQAQGAGADRVTTGMSHAFGKAIGRSVRVRKGQILFSVLVDEAHVKIAKNALLKSKSRFPCGVTLAVSTDVTSIGTKPTPRRVEAEEKAAEEAAAAEAKEEGKEEKAEKKGKEEKKGEKAAEEKGKEEKGKEEKGKKEEKKPEKK